MSAVAPEDDGYRRALGLRGMKRNQFLAAVSAAQLCFGAILEPVRILRWGVADVTGYDVRGAGS